MDIMRQYHLSPIPSAGQDDPDQGTPIPLSLPPLDQDQSAPLPLLPPNRITWTRVPLPPSPPPWQDDLAPSTSTLPTSPCPPLPSLSPTSVDRQALLKTLPSFALLTWLVISQLGICSTTVEISMNWMNTFLDNSEDRIQLSYGWENVLKWCVDGWQCFHTHIKQI